MIDRRDYLLNPNRFLTKIPTEKTYNVICNMLIYRNRLEIIFRILIYTILSR